MSGSDSHVLSTASSLSRLGERLRDTDPEGSDLGARQGVGLAGFVVIAMSRSKRSRTPGRPAALAMSALRAVVCGDIQRIDLSQHRFRGSISFKVGLIRYPCSSRASAAYGFAHPVTEMNARLGTRLLARDYLESFPLLDDDALPATADNLHCV